jgi:hypothetical protein
VFSMARVPGSNVAGPAVDRRSILAYPGRNRSHGFSECPLGCWSVCRYRDRIELNSRNLQRPRVQRFCARQLPREGMKGDKPTTGPARHSGALEWWHVGRV